MLPEEKARIKIDKQLIDAGWDIVAREDYIPNCTLAVKEALMQGGNESDYLLFMLDTVVDRIVPHRGAPKLFWDQNNWQALCKRCHDKKTGREDSRPVYKY